MNSSDNNLVYACDTDENLEWFEKLSYWTEGVFQLALGNNQMPCISGVTCHFHLYIKASYFRYEKFENDKFESDKFMLCM